MEQLAEPTVLSGRDGSTPLPIVQGCAVTGHFVDVDPVKDWDHGIRLVTMLL